MLYESLFAFVEVIQFIFNVLNINRISATKRVNQLLKNCTFKETLHALL